MNFRIHHAALSNHKRPGRQRLLCLFLCRFGARAGGVRTTIESPRADRQLSAMMIRIFDRNSGQSKEVDGGDSGMGRMVWFCQTYVNLSSLVGFLLGFVSESNFLHRLPKKRTAF